LICKIWQNLDIRKATNSNIKVWVFENLDKSKKCRGPLVSLRCRLNGARSLASRTCTSCEAMHQRPKLCRGRRPRVPPRVPSPASPYPLSAEAKPHLFSPREEAIDTPPPPLFLHAALASLPATVRCHALSHCRSREPSPSLCTASPRNLPAPLLGLVPSSPLQRHLSTSQSPPATIRSRLCVPDLRLDRTVLVDHSNPRICRSTVPSLASSSRRRAPLQAAAYGESLYSPVSKLGSPPRHLTLAPLPPPRQPRRRPPPWHRWGKVPLFWPWAEKAEWAKPVSWARPSASMG
jgi:hypothetical protein